MLEKLFFPKKSKPEHGSPQRDLNREKHFADLYVQSFAEMRSRSPQRSARS